MREALASLSAPSRLLDRRDCRFKGRDDRTILGPIRGSFTREDAVDGKDLQDQARNSARSIAPWYSESKSRSPSHFSTTSISSRPGPEKGGGLFLQANAAPTFCAASTSPG